MKRTTKYVALDVHQASTVASVREERGRRMPQPVMTHESDHPSDGGLLGSPAIVPQPELRPHERQEFRD